MARQRDRGRILTEAGKEKIKQAIRAWEFEHERRCTQEKLRELTGLDPTTSSKILNTKGGADRSKIEDLFRAFGIQLEEADLRSMHTISAPEPNPNFIGREDAIADLNALVRRGAKLIVIQARGGVGKTTLAWEYLRTQGFDLVLELWMAKETQNIASVEGVLEEWLRRYFNEEPGREFGVTLERLRQKLRDPSQKIGILIDNLEPALDQSGKFVEAHRRYVELMRVLSDRATQSVTLITSRERLQEADFGVEHYLLRSLNPQAWQQFFEHHGIQHDETALVGLHRAYGGNAKAMEILRSVVQADFSGNLAEYWQVNQDDLFIERALEDIVIQQFDRLQQHDPNAYNLLCRMGCYRFQDAPTVPLEGLLCLLWDVPERERRRIVKRLLERSLVELENGEYLLHPVIRAEAINQLRLKRDWEIANQKAAEFWTANVKMIENIDDALRALEAFYHYLEIQQFEKAGSVILQKRICSLPEPEQLGRSLYKIGLSQQLESVISSIVDRMANSYQLCEIYMLLGVSNQILGNIHKAISYHEESIRIASECLKVLRENDNSIEQENIRKIINQRAKLGIAICKMELGEFRESIEIFENLNSIIQTGRGSTFILIALGFLYSCLGYKDKASDCVEEACRRKDNTRTTSGYGFFFLGITYKNLGEFDKATFFLTESIKHADLNHYSQVKARSISGLGEVKREQRDYKNAVLHHTTAIELLYPLAAKLDLAETHYQLGITYQKMGEFEKSNREHEEAIRLFTEMKAPKQVERVKQSMKGS